MVAIDILHSLKIIKKSLSAHLYIHSKNYIFPLSFSITQSALMPL